MSESDQESIFYADWLYEMGHNTNTFESKIQILAPYYVDIMSPFFVSRPCWEAAVTAAERIERIYFDFPKLVKNGEEQDPVYRFIFSDLELARKCALSVQVSARSKRKADLRKGRLEQSGGFHDQSCLDALMQIQEGKCYYSGDALVVGPKNFDVDHIVSIYLGGSGWPINLALATKSINIWKGSLTSADQTLRYLAVLRGNTWLKRQREFCRRVDEERVKLDRQFKLINGVKDA